MLVPTLPGAGASGRIDRRGHRAKLSVRAQGSEEETVIMLAVRSKRLSPPAEKSSRLL